MNTTQEELFVVVAKPVVEDVIRGINGTIITYGQTGSGKTFTLYGSADCASSKGIIQRSLCHLFNSIDKELDDFNNTISVSSTCAFMEIYNEQIFDLLASSQSRLRLRENAFHEVFVDGCQEQVIENAHEALEVVDYGWKHRSIASTSMNHKSSRSHAVFTVTINNMINDGGVRETKQSRLTFVDLAGSERLDTSNAKGKILKEAIKINQSLSSLGNVIKALEEISNGKKRIVPYRNSLLTRMLKNSIGGSSRTTFVACVHAGAEHYNQTSSTLQFAQRVTHVKSKSVSVNFPQRTLKELQLENKQLKEMLRKYRQQNLAVTTPSTASYDSEEHLTDLKQMVLEEQGAEELQDMEKKCEGMETTLKSIKDCGVKLKEELQVSTGNVSKNPADTLVTLHNEQNTLQLLVTQPVLQNFRDILVSVIQVQLNWQSEMVTALENSGFNVRLSDVGLVKHVAELHAKSEESRRVQEESKVKLEEVNRQLRRDLEDARDRGRREVEERSREKIERLAIESDVKIRAEKEQMEKEICEEKVNHERLRVAQLEERICCLQKENAEKSEELIFYKEQEKQHTQQVESYKQVEEKKMMSIENALCKKYEQETMAMREHNAHLSCMLASTQEQLGRADKVIHRQQLEIASLKCIPSATGADMVAIHASLEVSRVNERLRAEIGKHQSEIKTLSLEVDQRKSLVTDMEVVIVELEAELQKAKEDAANIQSTLSTSTELAAVGSECRDEQHVATISKQKDALIELRKQMRSLQKGTAQSGKTADDSNSTENSDRHSDRDWLDTISKESDEKTTTIIVSDPSSVASLSTSRPVEPTAAAAGDDGDDQTQSLQKRNDINDGQNKKNDMHDGQNNDLKESPEFSEQAAEPREEILSRNLAKNETRLSIENTLRKKNEREMVTLREQNAHLFYTLASTQERLRNTNKKIRRQRLKCSSCSTVNVAPFNKKGAKQMMSHASFEQSRVIKKRQTLLRKHQTVIKKLSLEVEHRKNLITDMEVAITKLEAELRKAKEDAANFQSKLSISTELAAVGLECRDRTHLATISQLMESIVQYRKRMADLHTLTALSEKTTNTGTSLNATENSTDRHSDHDSDTSLKEFNVADSSQVASVPVAAATAEDVHEGHHKDRKERLELSKQGESKQTTKIHVAGVVTAMTEQDLFNSFCEFGEIEYIYIPSPCRSFAFVYFRRLKSSDSLKGKYIDIKGIRVYATRAFRRQ